MLFCRRSAIPLVAAASAAAVGVATTTAAAAAAPPTTPPTPAAAIPPGFVQQLRRALPAGGQVVEDDDERRERGKPWSSYHQLTSYPRVIVSPSSTEEVAAVMKLCSHHKVPVVPFGGGTSLEGQTLAPRGGVSLDFSRMKRILAVNEGDQDAHVQAGVGYVELNEHLRPRGLWFPLDPGPGATVGGMCACRCSGSTAVRYGTMRENVLNLTAVLQDGTVVRTGSRARKSAAGYDLTRLLVGSEGTLAVITEATLVRVITLHCTLIYISSLPSFTSTISACTRSPRTARACACPSPRCVRPPPPPATPSTAAWPWGGASCWTTSWWPSSTPPAPPWPRGRSRPPSWSSSPG